MKIRNLRELFEAELRYAYDCEKKLVKKGLPTMIEAAQAPELKKALEEHLEQTRNQIARNERVFAIIGAEPKTEDNDILDEITSSAEDMIDDIETSSLRDAALIAGGNKVEHYEMALYGSLVAWAEQLGYNEAASLLQQNLEEEKSADAKLTRIGETAINERAGQEQKAA